MPNEANDTRTSNHLRRVDTTLDVLSSMNWKPAARVLSRRYGLVVLAALCMLATTVVPVAATAASEPIHTEQQERTAMERPTTVLFQQDTPTNNSTIRHQDPEEISAEGNLTNLQQWVSSRIETTLVECAEQVENTTNESCRAIDEELPRLTTQYRDLAQQTGTTNDDNVSRVLGRTGTNQREFVEAVAAYRASLSTYREAERQGDTELMLDSARNVSRRGDRVVALGSELSAQYEVIRGNSTLAVSPAVEIVDQVTVNTSETTDEVRTAEFEATELTLSSNRSAASFADPASLTGQLRAQNGTPLANRTVLVQTPEGTRQTTTNATGRFAVTYRPVNASLGNTTVTARYRPGNDSVYIDSVAETTFSVRPTTATLDVDVLQSSAAFGDAVQVRATLSVGSTRVADVPIQVTLGGVPLSEVITNESGVATGSGLVPASIDSGTIPVTARVAQDDLALQANATPDSVQIDQTTPRLTVESERLTADRVRISGEMVAGGTPVSGATLEIRREDTVVGTVETGEDGGFETNASLSGVAADEPTTLRVEYDPSGGNLEGVVLQVPVNPSSDRELPDSETGLLTELLDVDVFDRYNLTPLAVGLIGLLVLLVLVTAVVYGNRTPLRVGTILSGLRLTTEAPDRSETAATGNEWGEDTGGESTGSRGVELSVLHAARERLGAGKTDEAIVSAYSAARQQLDEQFGIDPVFTHWELLFLYQDSLDSDRRAALKRLTSAYERAAYSHTSATDELAHDAIESAAVLLRDAAGQQPNGVQADD